MKESRRLTSIVVAVIIVMTMFFSATFLSCNANHSCNDENCPICEMIQMEENVLNKLSMAIAILAVALCLCVPAQESMAIISDAITYYSPVKLKVKMLN